MDKSLANPRIYFSIAGIMVILALQIAWSTRFNAHPDEISHGSGFCYFETHTWIPDLNADNIYYDPYGSNRIYDGEIGYLLYGRLVGAIRPYAEPLLRSIKPPQVDSTGCEYVIEFYRWLNVGLYAVTLGMVFLSARKSRWIISIAVVLLCLPQVVYIFSYANDDAWGISFSIFLFLFVANLMAKPCLKLSDLIYLGILTGIVLLSKKNYWLSIPFSYALFWPRIDRIRPLATWLTGEFLIRGALLVSTTLVIAAPFLIIYPLTQGNYAEKFEQMNEQRARADFKPSAITAPGYRMAARTIPFEAVLGNYKWYSFTAKSFYGIFGYFAVILPSPLYRFAAGVMLFLIGLTGLAATRNWVKLSIEIRQRYILAPVLIGFNVFLSLYRSWTYDYQYQGRYLFPSLVPLAIILGGTLDVEGGRTRILRLILSGLLYGLCIYVLWTQVAQNPALR